MNPISSHHMRRALIVGVDYYISISPLFGCVNDAHSVKSVLERHSDGSINFGVKLLVGSGLSDGIFRADLKEAIRQLFEGDSDIALFYFAGHGYIESTGGYICPSDTKSGDDGLAISEILTLANKSKAKNKIIILDSCHSGIAGTNSNSDKLSELTEGMTILTASTSDQYASEANGSGVFTTLLVDALSGAAGNLVGDVTPGSVYSHIDQSLGPWEQRPVFKTNVKTFVSLRKVQPLLSLAELHRLTEFFPNPGSEFQLDPTFEPERSLSQEQAIPAPILDNTLRFALLQRYVRVNLVVPVGAPHMWHAAMNSKTCKLTVLGEHYRRLVERGRV